MQSSRMTIEGLNQRAEIFWDHEKQEMTRRLQRPAVLRLGTYHLNRHISGAIPIQRWPSFESILADAEEDCAVVAPLIRSESARDAGAKSKKDNLTKVIESQLKKRPNLSERELVAHLKAHHREYAIDEITESEIFFVDGRARSKTIPISGLRCRLSRAKKRMGLSQSR